MRSVGVRLSAPPRTAFERIYREHYRRVRWVVRARGVPEAALDDVVHDAFLSIHRRLPERDRDVPLATWVVGVARSVAFSHRRATARRRQRQADAPVPAGPRTPDEQLELDQAWATLAAFVDSLPAEQREVFVLTQMVGLSMAEIAQTTGTKTNTLYSRLRLARKRFVQWFPQTRDPEVTNRFLRHAGRQERPSARKRQAAWVALAGELSGPAIAVPIASAAITGWKGVMLGGMVALGTVVAWPVGEGTSSEAKPTRSTRAAQPRAAVGAAVDASPPQEPRVQAPDAPPPSTRIARGPVVASPDPAGSKPPKSRRAHAEPVDPGAAPERAAAVAVAERVDPLEAEVAVLREVRLLLARDRAPEALARLDANRDVFQTGLLETERRAVEREAACRAGDRARAARVAPASKLGDEPCADFPPKKKTTTQ